MKKVISLFIAVAVLCLATSALATPTASNVDGERNNQSSFGATNSGTMPCFRPGDTITFDLNSLASGEVTLITYKDGSESSLSDSNVQYINQYTVTSGSSEVTYTIRDQASGVYVLKVNDASGTAATFYYKIGNATVTLIGKENGVTTTYNTSTPGTPYRIAQTKDGTSYSVGFLAKVTLDSGVSLTEIGANPGFAVKKDSGAEKKYGFGVNNSNGADNSSKSVASLQDAAYELEGEYSFIYGLTIYNVTSTSHGLTARAILDADE